MLSQFFELPDNPLAIFFIFVIGVLMLSLMIAIWSDGLRSLLRKMKLLDSDESPKDFLFWILGLIIVVRIVQVIIIQPFIVDGSSMLPTFYNNNLLIVDKLSYKLGTPHRGDVIVFKFKKEGSELDGKYFIKRLIGLPGDTVIVDGTSTSIITANGTLTPDESIVKFAKVDQYVSKQLQNDEYFVMGDNRDGSYDSRIWGAVHAEQIAGKVIFEIFPTLDVMPGKVSYTKEN
jgi:signal peptidase I